MGQGGRDWSKREVHDEIDEGDAAIMLRAVQHVTWAPACLLICVAFNLKEALPIADAGSADEDDSGLCQYKDPSGRTIGDYTVAKLVAIRSDQRSLSLQTLLSVNCWPFVWHLPWQFFLEMAPMQNSPLPVCNTKHSNCVSPSLACRQSTP